MFFGRVQWAKADSYSVIKTRTANLRVHWAGNMLPPAVYVGQTVCAAGRLTTYDGGRMVLVTEAVPIPAGRDAMRRFAPLLDELCANPAEWCPDLLDRKGRRPY